MRRNRNGVSIIELLLAISLVVIVVVTLSVAYPTLNNNVLMNRQRWAATQLANTQIKTLQSQPYDYVNTTWDSFGTFNTNCNCTTADFSAFSSTTSQVAGTNFVQKTCINYVSPGPPWSSQCGTTDTGYKNILVRVGWSLGSSSSTVTEESMLTRY